MKTVTLTAVMALLVTIPILLKRARVQPVDTNGETSETAPSDENQRYAIDEFMT